MFYSNYSEALRTVALGEHWGALHFKANYSSALFDRLFGMVELKVPSNETLDTSEVHVSLDMTNQQVMERGLQRYQDM